MIPTTEKIWLTRVFPDGRLFYITSKASRDMYFLYKDVDGEVKKIAKAKSPVDLENKMEGA